jgi:OmpA-OmpF porin, OOP family
MRIAAARALIVLTGVAMPPQAGANDVGFYTGAYVGMANKTGDRAEYEALRSAIHDFYRYTPTTFESSFDETDITYSLFVGYRFNRYLAVEGGYADLGKIAYSSQSTGAFPNDTGILNANIESETSGFQLSLLGVLPLSHNWELYGRLGNLFATNRLRVSLTARSEVFIRPGGDRISDSFSISSSDTYAGVGLGRRIFDSYDLRVEYQRFFDAGVSSTGGIGDLDTALLGLTVTF